MQLFQHLQGLRVVQSCGRILMRPSPLSLLPEEFLERILTDTVAKKHCDLWYCEELLDQFNK